LDKKANTDYLMEMDCKLASMATQRGCTFMRDAGGGAGFGGFGHLPAIF